MSKEKVVCFDCGIKYLTRKQRKEGGVATFFLGTCCECKNLKHVTSIRHYNNLKLPIKTKTPLP